MLLDELVGVIKTLKERIEEHRDELVGSETRTKTVLIEPLLRALGWDVSEPKKVLTEYHADIFGIKAGERVDYALMRDGEPTMVLEAKYLDRPLNDVTHAKQLFRYLQNTSAKVGILTNGRRYQFYQDTNDVNVKEFPPLFSVDLTNASPTEVDLLRAFSEECYDPDAAIKLMEEAYYKTAIRETLVAELKIPQREFVQWVMSKTYDGSRTAGKVEWFTEHVKEALKDFCVANHETSVKSTETNPLPPEPPVPKASSGKWTRLVDFQPVKKTKPPPIIRFENGEERSITYWKRLVVEVAESLIRKGVLTENKCPVSAGFKTGYCLVNSIPEHPSGKPFYGHIELSNGLYIYTYIGSIGSVPSCIGLLKHLGQDPAQVWLKTS